MNLKQIKLLCQKAETNQVEFKTSTAQLQAAFKTLCAFLNGKGGTVLIGVRDDGRIQGQGISDGTRKEIATEIKKIEPTTTVDVDYMEIGENKFVIALHVEEGKHAPYVYDGRPFQRNESTTHRMSQHRYEQLIVDRGQLSHSWEAAIAPEYSIDDLDHDEIYKTISDGISENRVPARAQKEDVKGILKRLNLMVGNNLKRAAVVLYTKQESMQFVQCMIKMARFKGINKSSDFIDNQQMYGNAFEILAQADSFLRRHLPIESFFKSDQFKRIDKPALPVIAVREALINAICHRDYSDYYTDISLAIFDDRLEIWNSGLLLKKLTVDSLKQTHDSVLRNKLIANVFYIRGLIERWGSGTNKMIDLCAEDHVPEPEFTERTGGLAITFKFKKPIGYTSPKIEKALLNKRQENILSLLKQEGALNINKIMSELEHTPSRRMVRKDLDHLRKEDLITLEGYGRKAVWMLKNNLKMGTYEEPTGNQRGTNGEPTGNLRGTNGEPMGNQRGTKQKSPKKRE